MNLRHALLHNTGWKLVTMIFTFVSNILIVRLLGVKGSGEFFYALAVFILISTVLRFGLENGIVYYTSKFPELTGRLAKFILFISGLQTLIAWLVLKYFINEGSYYTLTWCIIYVVGNIMIYYVTAFYQAKLMYISINVIGTFFSFFQTIIFLVIYFSKINNWLNGWAGHIYDAILIVMSCSLFLQIIVLIVFFYFNNKKHFRIDKVSLVIPGRVIKYSVFNFLGTVLMFLVLRADFYFVDKFCDKISLGNYLQVARIGQMLLIIPTLFGGVIFPYTVQSKENIDNKIYFFCRLLTLVFLFALTALLLTGNYIFVWMLGNGFHLVFPGILATFLGVYCLAMGVIFISYFEGKNMQKIIVISNVAILLILVSGDYLFVPVFGFLAVAIIFSVSNLAGMMILLYYFIKKTSGSVKDIFIFKASDASIFRLRN